MVCILILQYFINIKVISSLILIVDKVLTDKLTFSLEILKVLAEMWNFESEVAIGVCCHSVFS